MLFRFMQKAKCVNKKIINVSLSSFVHVTVCIFLPKEKASGSERERDLMSNNGSDQR